MGGRLACIWQREPRSQCIENRETEAYITRDQQQAEELLQQVRDLGSE